MINAVVHLEVVVDDVQALYKDALKVMVEGGYPEAMAREFLVNGETISIERCLVMTSNFQGNNVRVKQEKVDIIHTSLS